MATKGKYNSERDEVLWTMVLEGWANESDGESDSITGHFARVSVSEAELLEVSQAFETATEYFTGDFDWSEIVGHFLVMENSDGFVTVAEYPTEHGVELAFRARSNYSA